MPVRAGMISRPPAGFMGFWALRAADDALHQVGLNFLPRPGENALEDDFGMRRVKTAPTEDTGVVY